MPIFKQQLCNIFINDAEGEYLDFQSRFSEIQRNYQFKYLSI